MSITAAMVKDLREKTGAGMMDCKGALKESNGDFERAIDFLRKKGLSNAAKKQDRATKEGLIYSYVHHNGKLGVMVEVSCETDFVARTDKFNSLVSDIAMHIASTDPTYLKREEVPEDIVNREKSIFTDQMKESGKPENIIGKIVDGKINKFYSQVCLLEQSFVKDSDVTITGLITNSITELGENISINRFTRFQLGAK